MKPSSRGDQAAPRSSARWLALAGVAVVAPLAFIAYLTRVEDSPSVSPPPTPAVAATPANELAVRGLHGELAHLRGAVAELEKRAPEPGAPRADDAPEVSDEEREEMLRDRATRTAQAIERTLRDEGRDPGWSATTEHQLRDGFGQTGLVGAHLDEAYCGATMCRVRVRFDSMALRDDGMNRVMRLVTWDSELIARADPADRRQFVIYASRSPGLLPTVE